MSRELKFNQRIFYVGQHNKFGMRPLDSRTRSGKLIDRVIRMCHDDSITHIKTNLFDADSWPDEFVIDLAVKSWQYRHLQTDDDVIVTLGERVSSVFRKAGVKTVEIPHPASIWATVSKTAYVERANDLISTAAAHAVSRDPETSRRYLEANGEDVDRLVADGVKIVQELISKAKSKQP